MTVQKIFEPVQSESVSLFKTSGRYCILADVGIALKGTASVGADKKVNVITSPD
jgi:hypothetical protein